MTLLAGALSVLFACAAMVGVASIGHAGAADARAQNAADAAALAAVAESIPGGSGRPESLARTYAELNGGRVLECICEPGSTAVQVRVAVGDVVARARAVVDPSLLGPLDVFATTRQLHPRMQAAVIRLLHQARGTIHVTSGYRAPAEQARLWSDALATYGSAEAADDWVARPGSSSHELGVAVDLGGDLTLARRLIAELGLPLHQPLTHEPWHFELIGAD